MAGKRVIWGITGRNCAGKDSVAEILVKRRGFERHSLSDALRHELAARGREITREALIEVGNELRHAEGPAVLAERMKELMRTDRVALVSIRNPAEVEALRGLDGFVLVRVVAPTDERFHRERDRNREAAVHTLEEFERLEARENGTDPAAQRLDATAALAEHEIVNDGSLEDLERAVLTLLDETTDG